MVIRGQTVSDNRSFGSCLYQKTTLNTLERISRNSNPQEIQPIYSLDRNKTAVDRLFNHSVYG